tara:strand:+ start:370 stop:510 length:141 start_codon:yes stop_codon:yes gene_type:complete
VAEEKVEVIQEDKVLQQQLTLVVAVVEVLMDPILLQQQMVEMVDLV